MNNYCKGCKKLFNSILERCPYCYRYREDYMQGWYEVALEIKKLQDAR